jgi:hypothetical protein
MASEDKKETVTDVANQTNKVADSEAATENQSPSQYLSPKVVNAIQGKREEVTSDIPKEIETKDVSSKTGDDEEKNKGIENHRLIAKVSRVRIYTMIQIRLGG